MEESEVRSLRSLFGGERKNSVTGLLRGKCEHLSGIECNVGGFGSLSCLEESYHCECPFKARHTLHQRLKNLVNVADALNV
ncbi:MAG: hypothetical protein HY365_02535 [Candidatus Aenigmarchaeota archaeon]|nr:hypothetical protein [Candidatus Aenigmarchaeota archaeon]